MYKYDDHAKVVDAECLASNSSSFGNIIELTCQLSTYSLYMQYLRSSAKSVDWQRLESQSLMPHFQGQTVHLTSRQERHQNVT
jgi:hypothetical protein